MVKSGEPGRPLVAILMGSDSDWPVMEQAAKMLDSFGVGWEAHPFSAHRSPELVRSYVVTEAPSRGIKVFIAAAGGAAHLAGVVAAHTTQPVIGVPINSKLQGMDSLLSTLQMPKGVPVATVAIDGAANAAILAVQCLALSDGRLAKALADYKASLVEGVRAADQKLPRRVSS
jgi:5-(carboxyamino)imidazole ribonucleotide mutase